METTSGKSENFEMDKLTKNLKDRIKTISDILKSNEYNLSPKVRELLAFAIKDYPQLANLGFETFEPKDEFDAGGYYDFKEDKNGEPVPVIFISEGDAQLLQPVMEIRKQSVDLNAQKLGITKKEMTPELMQLFIIAHEMGHVYDYKRNYKANSDLKGWEAVEEMQYDRENVLTMLPVEGINPTHLASQLNGMSNLNEVVKLFPKIKNYFGFDKLKTVEDVIAEQERMYRSSSPETYADDFATKLLKKHFDINEFKK
jgi:hypothetical protein